MKRCYHCMHQIDNENAQFCPQCSHSLTVRPAGARYLRPGAVLQGKFIVGYPLGAGGFGNTYIGWNQALSCKVAVKEFYPKQYCRRAADQATVIVSDEKAQGRFQEGRRQFLEEARHVAALQDIPGVVKISHFFEENGTGYIVMEYLEGMTVKAILEKSGGKMDYEWCRKVILTALYTLREVHRRGVLHRDIAPDNVMVTSDGIVKLIDFGAAKHISAMSGVSPEIILKVGYAPIEQYSRQAAQGVYTDIYAIAAMFYRMITGQRPIPANERLEEDALILPSDMGIQIPEKAQMGMMVALSVQPQYRLQSADEFMEALDGKDFIPVYDIGVEGEIKEKKGIRERIARISIGGWAKICLGGLCLVALALFLAARHRNSQAQEALAKGVIVMNDLSGMTKEEAAASIEELEEAAKAQGVTLEIDFEMDGYIFDLDQAKDGTVAAQTVKPSAVLYDTENGSGEAAKGFKREEDGTVTGKVSCSLYSSTKLHYSDVSGLNAYAMARKLGIDPGDGEHFAGTDEAADLSYYDLVRLETPDGPITPAQLKKKKNQKKEIAYEKDKMRIVYSNIPFFYWKALPDFKAEYGTLEKTPAQDTYILKNESDREATGEKKRLEEAGGIVDLSYCAVASSQSAKGPHKGDILEQTRPAGEELDVSRAKPEGGLLHVIGEEFLYGGKTGNQLKKELEDSLGGSVQVTAKGSGVMTQPVSSVTVLDAQGKEINYFRKGEAVTVALNLEDVPAPEPESAQPAYSDSGGYTEDYAAPAAPAYPDSGGGGYAAPAAPAPVQPAAPAGGEGVTVFSDLADASTIDGGGGSDGAYAPPSAPAEGGIGAGATF